jgi:hypothetical protein
MDLVKIIFSQFENMKHCRRVPIVAASFQNIYVTNGELPNYTGVIADMSVQGSKWIKESVAKVGIGFHVDLGKQATTRWIGSRVLQWIHMILGNTFWLARNGINNRTWRDRIQDRMPWQLSNWLTDPHPPDRPDGLFGKPANVRENIEDHLSSWIKMKRAGTSIQRIHGKMSVDSTMRLSSLVLSVFILVHKCRSSRNEDSKCPPARFWQI